LKSIAAVAGVSQQTVSMALRDHHRVGADTRERIQRLAAAMGYRPDPAMAALARYRTDGRRAHEKWERVALVHDWETADGWQRYFLFRRLGDALVGEATRRGITLETFWLGKHRANSRQTFRRIFNQGIRGILVAPPPESLQPHPIEFPRKDFHVVTFGPAHLYPDRHVVQFDFFENLRLAWRTLWNQGFRRIGLVVWDWVLSRTGDAFLGAYLTEKNLNGIPCDDLQPCVLQGADRNAYESWIAAEQPDAILTIVGDLVAWNRELEIDLPLAQLSVNAPGEVGIDVDPGKAAMAAFELLLLDLQRSLTQQHGNNLRILIPGKWVEKTVVQVS